MMRRKTDGDRRRAFADLRVWPIDTLPIEERRDPGEVGRRRLDGLSIELLWERVEALTTQTADHSAALDILPQLLQKIEAGLEILGARGSCGLPVEIRDPDGRGGVDLDAPPDRVETCLGTERTAGGLCRSCGGAP